jgi:O-antigen ligase
MPTSETSLLRERAVLLHTGIISMVSAVLYGGMGPHGEWILAGLASPSAWFLFTEAQERRARFDQEGVRRLVRWLAPLALLGFLVVLGALNPSHRETFLYDGMVLRPLPHVAWLPASARPLASLRTFCCLGGLALTGLTLAFCVHSRFWLRRLVSGLVLNASALAVLGTLQRQTHATGPFFGATPSPNPAWFATFFYYNHWGAFATLATTAALALVFHSLNQPHGRDWLHGNGPLLTLAILLIAATAPLSGSRSATALIFLLIIGAIFLALRHVCHIGTRHSGHAALTGAIGIGALLACASALISFQSREVLAQRFHQTMDQVAEWSAGPVAVGRPSLYADTWRMAADKPLFGWGLESYGPIFVQYSRFRPGSDGLRIAFEDAHSDWLQSLAETGFIGTTALLLFALIPLFETLRQKRPDAFSGWLLCGCALIAAYAWVEFPLACPAVAGLWWILFFSSLRHLQLSPKGSGSTTCSP